MKPNFFGIISFWENNLECLYLVPPLFLPPFVTFLRGNWHTEVAYSLLYRLPRPKEAPRDQPAKQREAASYRSYTSSAVWHPFPIATFPRKKVRKGQIQKMAVA